MRPGGSYDRRTALREENACRTGTSAAERLWFNKELKLTSVQRNLQEVVSMLLEDGEPRLESEFVGVQTIKVA
jgi:hypothetical protein